MYRIEIQSTASEPFSGFAEAQDAHIALVTEAEGLALPERGDAETARAAMTAIAQLRRAIRAFEWRLAATGKVIADPQQRSLAQSLLDYWALRHVELRDKAWQLGQADGERRRPPVRRSVSPRTLLPVDENLAATLAEAAEQTYLAFADDAQRAKARQLFLAIANPYGGNQAADSQVAGQFTAANVIVASGAAGGRYTLAHDSLAQQWPRLGEWMVEARQNESRFEAVLASAQSWEEAPVDDALPQGAALEQASEFADRDPVIARYVEAAHAEAVRRKRFNRKVLAAGVALFTVVAIALLSGAIALRREPAEVAEQLVEIEKGKVEIEKHKAEDEKLKLDDKVTEEIYAALTAPETATKQDVVAVSTEEAVPELCTAARDAEGYLWIGSPGNSQVFDQKGKPIEPNRIKPGMALGLRAWFNLRESMPVDDGQNIAGAVKGTASARSSVIALGPAQTVAGAKTAQYWVSVSLPSSVYIQIPSSADSGIQSLVDRLRQERLQVPAVQRLDMPPGLNEVRYYYEQDAGRARQVACLANRELRTAGSNRIEIRSLANTSLAAKVSNGTIELWVFPRSGQNAPIRR